jgi:acyl-CoA thioesterase
MVIYTLVEASTADDALATGKTVFDRFVGAVRHASAVFDYYAAFDEEETSVAGSTRWGDLAAAAPVGSDEGKELLKRGWKATEDEFQRNLNRVKEALDDLSDEAIMRDEAL